MGELAVTPDSRLLIVSFSAIDGASSCTPERGWVEFSGEVGGAEEGGLSPVAIEYMRVPMKTMPTASLVLGATTLLGPGVPGDVGGRVPSDIHLRWVRVLLETVCRVALRIARGAR